MFLRFVSLIGLLIVIAACSKSLGSLIIEVSGLPTDAKPIIEITGPSNYKKTIQSTQTLQNLSDGEYTVSAQTVNHDGKRYETSKAQQKVNIKKGKTVTVNVTYELVALGSLKIEVSGLPTGTEPIIEITGPNSYQKTIKSTQTLQNLSDGEYTVSARVVDHDGKSYETSQAQQKVTVEKDKTIIVEVKYKLLLEEVACWTNNLISAKAVCGLLEVPADYEATDGRTLKTAWSKSPALGNPTKDPIVFLIGGPGPSGVLEAGSIFTATPSPFAAIRQNHEIILVDYRGTGMSEPFVGCDEPESLEDLTVCSQAIEKAGLEKQDFLSANFARDVDRLLNALKIDKAILYGASYGTRLALTIARDVPERISAMILDGVFPPEVNGLTQGAIAPLGNLDHLVQTCANSTECLAKFGDLRARIENIASPSVPLPLQKQSSELTILSGPLPLQSESSELTILAEWAWHPAAPAFVVALEKAITTNDTDTINKLVEAAQVARDLYEDFELEEPAPTERSLSVPMLLSIICSEEGAFIDEQPQNKTFGWNEAVLATFQNFTGGSPISVEDAKLICNAWQAPAAPDKEIQPVKSNLPTLVLSTGRDSQTSFLWGVQAAQNLSNSQHLIFPFNDHVVGLESSCAVSIMTDFASNPKGEINTTCIESQHNLPLVLGETKIIEELSKRQIP